MNLAAERENLKTLVTPSGERKAIYIAWLAWTCEVCVLNKRYDKKKKKKVIYHMTMSKGKSAYVFYWMATQKVFHCLPDLYTGTLWARFTCICICMYLAPDLLGLVMQSAPGHPAREWELSKHSSEVWFLPSSAPSKRLLLLLKIFFIKVEYSSSDYWCNRRYLPR